MLITTLRPFRGDEGFVRARTTMEVSDSRAKRLVEKGLATYAVGALQNKAIPASRSGPSKPEEVQQGAEPEEAGEEAGGEATAAAGADPTPARRRGSRTGAGKSRSSSRQARARK